MFIFINNFGPNLVINNEIKVRIIYIFNVNFDYFQYF